jgi:hypothetical protein
MDVLSKPARFVRKVDETVLNHPSHPIHPHDFVHRRFVTFDCVHPLANQFLDQLRARRSVFDQDCLRTKHVCLLQHSALQFRIADTFPKDLK